MENLALIKSVFPFIEIVDYTTRVYEGPVYYSCSLPRKVRATLVPGREYLCSMFGVGLKKQPLLFMFNLSLVETDRAKVVMSFYPFKPEHECQIADLVDHLLHLVAVHNKNRRRVAALRA